MRSVGRVLVCVAATVAALHAQNIPGGPPRDLNRRGEGVNRLERWVGAVQAHRGGIPDAGTRLLETWTAGDLEELTIDLPSLLKLMDDPSGDEFSVWIEGGRDAGRRRVVYSGSELERLRRTARSLGGRDAQARPAPGEEARIVAAQNRVVKRGAAIHTTIALNRPEQIETGAASSSLARWGAIFRFNDGRQLGVDASANQWRFARRLLDMVVPRPSSDSAVLAWYRASSSALLRDFQMHADHFDHALRLFPDDPLLLMFAGSLHEALASTRVQEFIKSAVVPAGVTLKVGSPRAELERAESLLRRAIKIDPRATEARVRLGRVLSLEAHYADALPELRRLDASAPQILQYYAALFTGEAAEAMGRRDDARAAYERAAELYPRAQAPRFGLSQLAASAGAPTQAVSVLVPVLSETKEPSSADDPFWTYHTAAGREADALLTQAYRTLSEASSR